mgnify:FL=1
MTDLAYQDFGPRDARPVVFTGSIASSTDMWLPQLDALAGGFRVIAVDHPGHGRSPDPHAGPGLTTVPALAADVLAVADALGVGEFDIVGLSLGGAIAQWLAATSGRVGRAVCMCTGAFMGGADTWVPRAGQTRADGMAPRVDGAVELWVTEAFRHTHPATTEALRRMILSTRGTGYAACADALAGWDFTDRLAEITVPVCTIAGPSDTSTPPEVVHAIAAGVSGPSETVTLSAGGHVPTVEVPDEVTGVLRDFLSR